ncbi:lactocepin [Clostridium acidisoli DSM 12555]|uniref:Lactocepin n=1 Tax=Clostridium acidisoli DSM 12555 TaxID=1121291 RepID=A0A1W1XBN6_9CLOT|nr:S8 family serine peptidase [Clostridium acidisoli]SMC20921.1 lactocepin [Clostridium acidisoli DSM 12555]
MKKRGQSIFVMSLVLIFASVLNFTDLKKSVKAEDVNNNDLKAVMVSAISNKIKGESIKSNKKGYDTFNENAPLNNNSSNGTVRVIVQLQESPAAENASKSIAEVKASQQNVLQSVQALPGAKIKKSFGYLINGFSADVKRSDINKIKGMSGVQNVTEAKVYHPDMYFAKNLTQVYSAWKNLGYKGEGMVVSIIDTGIDYTHKDMKITDTTKEKLHSSDVSKMGGKGKFFTDKVPYGYNFADENQNIIDYNKTEQHGMHVAGIVAANGNDEDSASFKAVQGIAPEAQLLAMKVFSNNPENQQSAYDDDLISAIEDSVLHHADIINMSLGSDSGFEDPNDPEQKAVKNATDKGTLVVISAGNSAISSTNSSWNSPQTNLLNEVDTGTVGDPGVADDALTVASYENTNKVARQLKYSSSSTSGTLNYSDGSGVPEVTLKENHSIVDCNLGAEADFTGKDVAGKIALIERGGNLTFSQKILDAEDAKAAGAIIYDKDISSGGSDDPLTMSVDASITIPSIGIGHDDGLKLKSLISNNLNISIDGTKVATTNSLANDMSPFTSWGPTPSLGFKPDISAPGGNIYSTQNDNKYTSMSGTSMAAPNVSGSEALILEAEKAKKIDVSGRDLIKLVKDTAINTSKVLMDKNNSIVPYSPRRQGAGIIQVQDAINNNVIATDDNGEADVALKEIGNSTTFNLNLKNYGNTDVTYTLENGGVLSEKITDAAGHFSDYSIDGSSMNFSSNTVLIPANGQAKVTVTIKLPQSFKEEQFVEGYVKFNSSNSNIPSLNVPYLGFYGDYSKPDILDKPLWNDKTILGEEGLISNVFGQQNYLGVTADGTVDTNKIAFSPNGDGNEDTVTPELSFLRNARTMEVDIVNKNNGNEKVLRQLSTDNKLTKDLIDNQDGDGGANIYNIGQWDGKLYNAKTGSMETALDGDYYYKFITAIDLKDAEKQVTYMPIKVDTVAPEIKIKSKPTTDINSPYKLIWKEKDKGVGVNVASNVVMVNGVQVDESRSPIQYDSQLDTYSCTINLQKGETNEVEVGVADYAGNVGTASMAIDTPVIVQNIYNGEVIGKTSLNENGKFNVEGIVSGKVKSLKINGANEQIDKKNFTAAIKLHEGNNQIDVNAYDKKGNLLGETISYKVILQTKDPEISITSPSFDLNNTFKTNKNNVTVTGEAKFEGFSDKNQVIINGTTLSDDEFNKNTGEFNYVIPVSGNTDLTIEAVDGVNNSSSRLYHIIANLKDEPLNISFNDLHGYDVIAPEEIKNDNLMISGTVNHKPKVFQINGVNIRVEDNLTFSKAFKLKQGTNKFLVYAEDVDGTVVSNYAYDVLYDSYAPKLTLTKPLLGEDGKIYTNKNYVDLIGSVYDNTEGYFLYIDGNEILSSSYDSNLGTSNLQYFNYRLKVKNNDIVTIEVKDRFGNSLVQKMPVVIGKKAPKVNEKF